MPLRPLHCLMVLGVCCLAPSAVPAQDRDYCRADGKLVLFLVDTTTPYDEIDKAVVVETVNKAFGALEGGDRFAVRTITDSYSRSERLFERCKPTCESESTIGRVFNCNDGMIRSDTEALQHGVVTALKQRLSRFTELEHSDIVRTIDAVAREEISDGKNTELYVFSDLIENSESLSGYELFNAGTKGLIARLESDKLIPDLEGTEVRIAGVGRAGTPERRPLAARELNKLIEFWTAYFMAASAADVEIGQNLVRKARSETVREKTKRE